MQDKNRSVTCTFEVFIYLLHQANAQVQVIESLRTAGGRPGYGRIGPMYLGDRPAIKLISFRLRPAGIADDDIQIAQRLTSCDSRSHLPCERRTATWDAAER